MIARCLLAFALCLAPAALLTGPGDNPAKIAIKPGKDQIEFFLDGKLVTRYLFGPNVPKPIFWPLLAPGEVAVTRAWPMDKTGKPATTDHVHQQSAWFCHGDVIPEGVELKQKVKGVEGVDFWAIGKGHGVIVCTAVGEPKQGDGVASIRTDNEWRTADGLKVLNEIRTLSLHKVGKATLLVFDIDLIPSAGPVVFGDTKEGSFGVRIHDGLREQGGTGKLTNAEGKSGEKQVWGQKSLWCDYSGEEAGKKVGLAIFDDPNNPYPALWHSRGYGLMAANPFGRNKSGFPAAKGKTDLVRLAKGEHLRLRYGILLHSGDVRDGEVGALYQQFVKIGKK